MANTRSNNSWFVDTAYSSASDDLRDSVVVTAILVTCSGPSGRVVLGDPATGATKLDIRIDPQNANANGGTKLIDLSSSPLVFSNGIRVLALTTANATLIGRQAGKSE